jgi:hypothetical protein
MWVFPTRRYNTWIALSTREVIAKKKIFVGGVCTSREVGCLTSLGEFCGIDNPGKFSNSPPSLGTVK